MAKKMNAWSKKAKAAKGISKRKSNATKAQKTRATKDTPAGNAVLDADTQREVDVSEEVEKGGKSDMSAAGKRRPACKKGDAALEVEVKRQEKIKEALDYRITGYTYREIADAMGCAPSTAHKWVEKGLAAIPRESVEAVLTAMLVQCDNIMSKLMPALDDTAPKDIIENILKVQGQMLKLHGLLQGDGGGGLSITLGKGAADGNGDSDDDIILRIKADAPVLRPDEKMPANPVL